MTLCSRPLTLLIVFFSITSHSTGNERCEYPSFFGSVIAPPERQLGEFRVELQRPAYNDRRAVQDHLVNSTVWARSLISRLAHKTSGSCGALVSAPFPDLRVFLRRGPPREGRDSSLDCAVVLQGMLNSAPDAGDIARVATDEASRLLKTRSAPAGPPIEASNILKGLLTKIYDENSLMHALVSVDYEAFQSFNLDNFQAWVRSQQAARTLQLTPLRFCGPEIDSSSARDTGAQQLPLSRTIPAQAIDYSIEENGPIAGRWLRRVVIVGEGAAVANSRSERPALAKYCSKTHKVESSSTIVNVKAKCVRDLLFDDSWIAFYCDPADCRSEHETEAAINKIASDPDVLALAKDNLTEGKPRGPYIVHIITKNGQ